MKLSERKKQKKDPNYYALIKDLEKTKQDLDLAYSNLSSVTEPDLIDCYIYEVQAVQMRYKFLLGRVKQLEKLL